MKQNVIDYEDNTSFRYHISIRKAIIFEYSLHAINYFLGLVLNFRKKNFFLDDRKTKQNF